MSRNSRSGPQFNAAVDHALKRIMTELPETLTYHNIIHTRDSVMLAAANLAEMTNLSSTENSMLRVAAAYHDIGFIEVWAGHERESVRIVEETLPIFGFNRGQIDSISSMILATRIPHNPDGLLGRLLADADLDILGRDDFFDRNELLRLETSYYQKPRTVEDWFAEQLEFLKGHCYFTEAARTLRDEGKKKNETRILSLLELGIFPPA